MAARNADDKKGFCLFFDWVKDLDFLSGAEAWTVVKALCDYYENGVNPVDNVPNELKSIVSMMFHQIQRQEDIKAKRAEAGRNGGFATAKNSKASSKVQQKSPTETNTNTETDTNTYIESENAPTPNKKAVSKTKSFGEYNHVKLTEEQYSQLVTEYGENVIAEYIKRVDEYCQQVRKQGYNDYNLTIRKWIRKDVEDNGRNERNGNISSGIGNSEKSKYSTTL